MKCECSECHGAGRIECPECDGQGSVERDIEQVAIPPGHRHAQELVALKADAERARKQAQELSQLKPDRASSYARQLRAVLDAINAQSETLFRQA